MSRARYCRIGAAAWRGGERKLSCGIQFGRPTSTWPGNILHLIRVTADDRPPSGFAAREGQVIIVTALGVFLVAFSSLAANPGGEPKSNRSRRPGRVWPLCASQSKRLPDGAERASARGRGNVSHLTRSC
jgi:hypothetical protein